MSNSDVDAVKLLGFVSSFMCSLLVKNGVNSNSSLSSLSVTDDKFTLATTNWDLNNKFSKVIINKSTNNERVVIWSVDKYLRVNRLTSSQFT